MKDGLLVAIGGALGSLLRYVTDSLFLAAYDYGKLISLFTVNTLGSFALGLLTSWILIRNKNAKLQLLLGTGLCGSFTTMSGFASAGLILVSNGEKLAEGLIFISLSTVSAIGAAWLGLLLGQKREEREEKI